MRTVSFILLTRGVGTLSRQAQRSEHYLVGNRPCDALGARWRRERTGVPVIRVASSDRSPWIHRFVDLLLMALHLRNPLDAWLKLYIYATDANQIKAF